MYVCLVLFGPCPPSAFLWTVEMKERREEKVRERKKNRKEEEFMGKNRMGRRKKVDMRKGRRDQADRLMNQSTLGSCSSFL